MTGPRRARASAGEPITAGEWAFLNDAARPADTPSGEWWALRFDSDLFRPARPTVEGLWRRFGPDVLQAWTASHPGTRPSLWWRFDAPEPQRQRLGGTGTPAHECLGYSLQLRCGVPMKWLQQWSVDYYTGRARDVDGELIGQEFAGCEFPHEAVDPRDPPTFESQAAYLDRHGLLTAAERRKLPGDAFAPERIAAAP